MKQILLIILAAAFAMPCGAQKGHYFLSDFGCGAHCLDYVFPESGYGIFYNSGYELKKFLGFKGGLDWQWFFTKRLGLGLGAQIGTAGADCELYFSRSREGLTDKENGLNYTEHVVFNNLEEREKIKRADFPLCIYFQTVSGGALRLLAGAGAVYSKILSQSYECKSGSISVGKYFPVYDLDYSGLDDKAHGVCTVSGFSGGMKLKDSSLGALGKIQLCCALDKNHRLELTAGVYYLYLFDDFNGGGSGGLFNSETFEYKGITSSCLPGRITAWNLGGNVGVRCRLGRDVKKKTEPERKIKPSIGQPKFYQRPKYINLTTSSNG